jgi:hypothetical protein
MRSLLLLGLSSLLSLACGALLPGGNGGGTTLPDPDGKWLVVAHVTSCMDATGQQLITVSGGKFDAPIFVYDASGCHESVSVQGTIEKGSSKLVVSGNEFLSGSCCNGGNGFQGFIEPSPTKGSASSSWGEMTFEKK